MNQPLITVGTEALKSVEPRRVVRHTQILVMLLQPGSIEVGWRTSDLDRFTYTTPGEMILCRRHVDEWFRTDGLHFLAISIADTALGAACRGIAGEVELRSTSHLEDDRVSALVAAVNAERVARFPSGQLFLDSVGQALALALVDRHAVRGRVVRTYRGGLGPRRLRRVVDLVHAKIEEDLSLGQMAEAAELSTAHFAQMFRRSTGQSPHQFLLRQRVERAKEMLRAPDTRVLDVAVACGFKTQQHFARIFRRTCGVSPTEYRREYYSKFGERMNQEFTVETMRRATSAFR